MVPPAALGCLVHFTGHHSLALRLKLLVAQHRVRISQADDVAVIKYARVVILPLRLLIISASREVSIASVFNHGPARRTSVILLKHKVLRDWKLRLMYALSLQSDGAPI